ncbi:hypothetical protein [Novosphingobium guangzhouense]|uniref:Uncharacterized protein n=1 Tax=Novosphingobium guangzhouense TaxID=1850347 RepID=A0A2K2G0R6_9SPHN|nr:hypothetical protein [Novosphingobium guangzhouense]PNU04617.1 hypothetical protein A8V01_19605 [Novosphingobium guangzhouense]
MTNNIVVELNEIEDAVADFIKDHKNPVVADIESNDKQISVLHAKSRDRTYDMVAALVDLAELLSVETSSPGYESFLVSRAISKPAKGHNPYMAFIKAVFAVKGVNGVWVFGPEQRSYEKHANHVRYLVNAKRQGLIAGSVQDFIRSFDGMLKGIEAQDREDNPNAAQAKRVADTRFDGKNAMAKATISETFSAKDGDLVVMYGRVSNGQTEVLHGKVVDNAAKRDSIYFTIGKAK